MIRGNSGDSDPRKVFGRALKHLRTRAGLSREDIGRAAYVSADMVAKIEGGHRNPSDKFIQACEELPALRSNGILTELWDELRDVAGQRYPGWFAEWPALESQAVRLRNWELSVVPGLLQTGSYARALLADRLGFDGDLDAAVTARIDRQGILSRDDPPEFFALVDEAVLHRPVGGRDVMGEQIDHLMKLPGRTTLRIIPAEVAVHDGLQGSFIIADLPGSGSSAYLESGLRGTVLQDARDVSELDATWERLTAEALPRSASTRMIEEVSKEWIK